MIISETRVRQYLLDLAKTKRTHPFTRVSAETMKEIESATRAHCVHIVESRPSKGQTL